MRGLGLTACLAVLSLAGVAPAAAQTPEEERPLPAPVPVADDALTAALETGELSEAEYALERARSVFQLARVRREFGDVERPSPRDVTLILRDLATRADDLAGVDRVAARAAPRAPAGRSGSPISREATAGRRDEAALEPAVRRQIDLRALGRPDGRPGRAAARRTTPRPTASPTGLPGRSRSGRRRSGPRRSPRSSTGRPVRTATRTPSATAGSTCTSTTSGPPASSATARATTRLPAARTSTPSRPTASSTTTFEEFGGDLLAGAVPRR